MNKDCCIEKNGATEKRKTRKTRVGVVVSAKCEKTRVVSVVNRVKHSLYGKFINKKTRIMIHDPNNECNVGNTVEIMESRPFSKMKRWRLVKVLRNS